MAITMTALDSLASTSNVASYAGASVTPTANRLQIVAVISSKASTPDLPTVSGNSLTFVQIATVTFSTIATPTKRLTLFRAMGTPTTGAITVAFGGVSQTGCAFSYCEFAGVATSGTNGSGAVLQPGTNAGDNVTGITVTLGAFSSANNGTYGAGGQTDDPNSMSVGSGYSGIHTTLAYGTPNSALLTEWRSDNDTTVDVGGNVAGNSLGEIAFEIVAASAAVAFPFAEVRPFRAQRGVPVRRGQYRMPVPPQLNPPFPFYEIKATKAYRGAPVRRGKQAMPVPAQVTVPNPGIVFNDTQRRAARGWLLRRGKYVVPPPPQGSPVDPVDQPRRARGLLLRRGKQAMPIQPQERPVVEQAQARRQRGWLLRRGKYSAPIPPQFNPPFPSAEVVQPRRVRGLLAARRRPTHVVPAQQAPPVNPDLIFSPSQHRAVRGWLLRRGKAVTPVPQQFNPPFPFAEVVQPRRARGLLAARRKPIEVVPTQQTVSNPVIVFRPALARAVRGLASRSGRQALSPQSQAAPLPVPERRRLAAVVRRRPRVETVPKQQNPPFPTSEIKQSRALRGLRLSRGRQATPIPAQVVVPNPAIVHKPSQKRVVRGWPVRRGHTVVPWGSVLANLAKLAGRVTPSSKAGADTPSSTGAKVSPSSSSQGRTSTTSSQGVVSPSAEEGLS